LPVDPVDDSNGSIVSSRPPVLGYGSTSEAAMRIFMRAFLDGVGVVMDSALEPRMDTDGNRLRSLCLKDLLLSGFL
jgi:hypothetical protein